MESKPHTLPYKVLTALDYGSVSGPISNPLSWLTAYTYNFVLSVLQTGSTGTRNEARQALRTQNLRRHSVSGLSAIMNSAPSCFTQLGSFLLQSHCTILPHCREGSYQSSQSWLLRILQASTRPWLTRRGYPWSPIKLWFSTIKLYFSTIKSVTLLLISLPPIQT